MPGPRLTLSGIIVGTVLNLLFWLDGLFTEMGRFAVAAFFLAVYTADWILERFKASKPA
jgi:hypothetical protein